MTSDVKFTRGRAAAGNPGDGVVDLSEIRRSEELIGLLGTRATISAQLLSDPAVALLNSLAADVDRAEAGPVPAPVPAISGWARAAAAVIAAVAGTMSVMAAGMLARLARGPASSWRRTP